MFHVIWTETAPYAHQGLRLLCVGLATSVGCIQTDRGSCAVYVEQIHSMCTREVTEASTSRCIPVCNKQACIYCSVFVQSLPETARLPQTLKKFTWQALKPPIMSAAAHVSLTTHVCSRMTVQTACQPLGPVWRLQPPQHVQ